MKPGVGRQAESSDREVLAGLVERVTFHNPENGFCVLRTRARGHRDLVTVVGHAAMVARGEWITASGEWVNDRTRGQQFKARFIRTDAPSSVEGIEKYLGSGMIRGIGPVYASKLVRAFGEKVFDVIEAEPERLSEATGLEAKTIHRLLEVDPTTGGFRRDADNPLRCSLLVVDETSMVDVMLMRALLAAVPDGAALLIVATSTSCPRWGRARCWPTSSLPARCGWCG